MARKKGVAIAENESSRRFWVVVLGDFGRSPRMQYHALSLSRKRGSSVHVLACGGSNPLASISEASNIHIRHIPEPPAALKKLPRLLLLMIKVMHQLMWMAWMMFFSLPSPASILMQTPPAIPTMALCWAASKWHGAKLIIDWHNFGFTIMGLTLGTRHWLVKTARAYELFWGKRGHSHFCVTKAMQQELASNWGVHATVLYDRPPAFFKRTDVSTTHALFTKLSSSLCMPTDNGVMAAIVGPFSKTAAGAELTPVTVKHPGQPATWRPKRPAVIVSSTSWTPDEDFGILLNAIILYDQAASTAASLLPDVLLLITGKGPLKEMYLAKIAKLNFQKVAIRTLWLEASDYPLLLGAADVGVSLHASSSGLDLPMKVVDMFGSGLPVCALAYSCIKELVADGDTGLLFSNAKGLGEQLQQLLACFPENPSTLLKTLRQGVSSKQQQLRWEDNWDRVAWPVLAGEQ